MIRITNCDNSDNRSVNTIQERQKQKPQMKKNTIVEIFSGGG